MESVEVEPEKEVKTITIEPEKEEKKEEKKEKKEEKIIIKEREVNLELSSYAKFLNKLNLFAKNLTDLFRSEKDKILDITSQNKIKKIGSELKSEIREHEQTLTKILDPELEFINDDVGDRVFETTVKRLLKIKTILRNALGGGLIAGFLTTFVLSVIALVDYIRKKKKQKN
jgi:hypothetical protein